MELGRSVEPESGPSTEAWSLRPEVARGIRAVQVQVSVERDTNLVEAEVEVEPYVGASARHPRSWRNQ